MSRLAISLVAVALCLLAVMGVAEPVEINVSRLPDPSAQDVGNRAENAVVHRFLQMHPNIRIKKGTGLMIGGGDRTMDTVPLMQIAGDISPDIIYVNFRQSETYVQRGFLRPLDEFLADMDQKELARRVPPAVRDVCFRNGPDGKKHWYAFPTSKVVRALAYRRDKFAAAGLDPDRPPRTWKQLEVYCRKLTDVRKGTYGMVFSKGDVSAWDFTNLVWSRGGDIIVKNARGEWEPRFNTPQVIDALYFYVKLNQQKIKAPDGTIARGVAFREATQGITSPTANYAMALTYLDSRLSIYQSELLGYAPVPYPEGAGKSASEINCQMFGIFAGVKDPKVARAAFEYILFLDSNEANRIRAKIYVQRGFGRFVNPVLLREFGYTDYLKQVNADWVRVYDQAMKTGKPEPYGKNCALVYLELSRPIEQAINDRAVIAALDRGDEKAVKKRLWAIMEQAQTETARRMFGTLPPKVRAFRHNATMVFLVMTAAIFVLATFSLIRHFSRSAPIAKPGQKRSLVPYLLLFPALLSVGLWQYYPLIKGTIIAFQDYNVMGGAKYVGVENFSTVLFDSAFWHAVGVTIIYTGLYMAFAFVSPIVLALLLSEIPRGKMFFRTVFYLPAVLSGIVVIFLWKSFYTASGLLNSIINGALGWTGLHISVGWLDSPELAMISILIPVIWAGMGPGCLIYLAAFKTIPDDLYEAAEVDGAGIASKVFRITMPSIKMLIMINAIGAFIGAFMSSEMIFAMTGGGPYTPQGATEVVGLQLFYTAFMYLKFGAANAMAWVLGFMLIGLTMMQLRHLSRVEFTGGR